MATAKSKRRATASRSAKAKTDITSIIEDEFGNYRIRAGRLSGNFVARAFPKPGSNSQGLMAEASGGSEEEAIDALKELLNDREAQRTAARRWEERSRISVPSSDEYIEAIRQTNLSANQRSMLKAHAIAGESGLTQAALMKAGGYKSKDTAIKVFARAGSLMGDFLGVEAPSDGDESRDGPARVLGFRQEVADVSDVWILHEELRHAIWTTL